jgi:hypothetical protein
MVYRYIYETGPVDKSHWMFIDTYFLDDVKTHLLNEAATFLSDHQVIHVEINPTGHEVEYRHKHSGTCPAIHIEGVDESQTTRIGKVIRELVTRTYKDGSSETSYFECPYIIVYANALTSVNV